jgi:hypothetical protein
MDMEGSKEEGKEWKRQVEGREVRRAERKAWRG